MNTKRSEAKLIQLIKDTYGTDIIIIIGNWSISKQMRNFISTPNIGLKRILSSEFPVYNFDEFRTSCLNYKTEKLCDNLYLPDAKKRMRKMHAILTFKMENKRLGCINRDNNGVCNIRKLAQHFLKTGERLRRYSRNVNLDLDNKEEKRKNKRFTQPLVKRNLTNCQVSFKLSGKNKIKSISTITASEHKTSTNYVNIKVKKNKTNYKLKYI